MSSFMVEELELPVAVGGHPALDFCNTRAGWGTRAPKEYLRTYDHLVVWTREAGLLQPGPVASLRRAAQADRAAAQQVLSGALILREAAYSVALGAPAVAPFEVVATQVWRARAAARMVRTPAGSGSAATWLLPRDGIDAPLLVVAAQVDDLLCSTLSTAVGACPGDGCGWLFGDLRRRRRWCAMSVCGNRAKARRHAERVAARRD